MDAAARLEVDVLIFGGGCAGLWLLDDLRRRGVRALLLEAGCLGAGQTSSAQGILHGGLKYSLSGLVSSSARMVREMPAVWQRSLEGASEPNLSAVRSRALWCYLWRGKSLKAWTAMLGAVTALQVRPVALEDDAVPPELAGCPRPIYRLDERVIDPGSLLSVLAERNRGLVWRIDVREGLEFDCQAGSHTSAVNLKRPGGNRTVRIQPRAIVLAAGEGNAELRAQIGLATDVMQRRPLRVALVRGELPKINGHCVDGAKTRVTITSDVGCSGRTVWQLGGQVSEDGVAMSPADFIRHARGELSAVLPGWHGKHLEWAQYTVNRAERSTSDGLMPGDVQILRDGNMLTVWPTKLVMAPLLSSRLMDLLQIAPRVAPSEWQDTLNSWDWPAPSVARPPWERELSWASVD